MAPSTRTIAVQATAPTGLTATDEATVNVAAIDEDFAFDGFKGLKDLPDVNEANLGTQFLQVQPRRQPRARHLRGRLPDVGVVPMRQHAAVRCE